MNPGEQSQFRDAIADSLARFGDAVLTYLRQRPSEVGDAVRLAEPELQDVPNNPNVLEPIAGEFKDGGARAEATLGIVWGARHPAAMHYARNRAAEMVGMRRLPDGRLVPNPDSKWSIPTTTRQQLQDIIYDLMDEDSAAGDLADRIEQHPQFSGLFGEYRAQMIARTELALAQNAGVLAGYRQVEVAAVLVLDNPTCKICGPVANTIQTLEWAQENLIGHPHCIRAFNTATFQRDAGGGAMGGAAGAGISVGTGLTGYNLEGQHDDDCKDEECRHEAHGKRKSDSRR